MSTTPASTRPDVSASLLGGDAGLFREAPLPVFLRDESGALVDANPAMAALFGYDTTDEFLAAMAAFPEQYYLDSETRQIILDDLSREGQISGRQYQAICRDGFVLWLEESARRVSTNNDTCYYFGHLRDITVEKSSSWALTEAEEKYRSIFEHAVEGLFQMTPAGRFVTVNAALARMLGFQSPRDLTQAGDSEATLFVSPGEREFLHASLSAVGVVRGFEAEMVRADGSHIWVSVHARAVLDARGTPVLFEGSMEDITERRRSQTLLRQNLRTTRKLFHQTVKSLSKTVRFRDPYTAGHQDNVARLAAAMARRMGLSEDLTACIRVAGQLHDIGKISVPVRYLCKPSRLVGLEWEFMKQHSTTGFEILKEIDFPWPVAEIVLAHHERLDGSGYPRGLSGPDIGIEARILAVADVLDAMASNRPYRPALGVDAALGELQRLREKAFDADAVDAAQSVIDDGIMHY